jgi:hypothetical protein
LFFLSLSLTASRCRHETLRLATIVRAILVESMKRIANRSLSKKKEEKVSQSMDLASNALIARGSSVHTTNKLCNSNTNSKLLFLQHTQNTSSLSLPLSLPLSLSLSKGHPLTSLLCFSAIQNPQFYSHKLCALTGSASSAAPT